MDETRQRLLNEFHKWYHDSFIGELDIVSMAGSKKVHCIYIGVHWLCFLLIWTNIVHVSTKGGGVITYVYM